MDDKDYEDLKWYKNKYGPRIEKRGVHNWKNLFRKPTLNEWIVLFCVLFALTLTFFYNVDIKNCYGLVEDIFERPYNYSEFFNWDYVNSNGEIEGDSMSIPFSLQIFQGVLT